jgi:hypothetical protein
MSTSALESKGFFAALFDFGFTSFITLKFFTHCWWARSC